MADPRRAEVLALIRRNVEQFGFHLYIVIGGAVPRFAYTIGLRETLGAELILGGAILYSGDDAKQIVGGVREQLGAGKGTDAVFSVGGLGSFTVRRAHASWTRALMLGALDYYQTGDIDAHQIVADRAHFTIDIPDMSKEWSATAEPIWKWLREDWSFAVPRESTATTNLDALRGARVTEVMRWEEDNWEMFAGSGLDVAPDEMRVVPFGTLLAADPSLVRVVGLEIGKGVWRDEEGGDWHPWG